MPLSWNEIKTRATAFSKEWEHESSEHAEAKTFWDGFFHVFGIHRRRVATFEQQVKKIDHKTGYIDLLWKSVIIVEHKSRGKDLDRAFQQAKDYFPGLNEKEVPRYILVSDFERFRLYDLESSIQSDFTLKSLIAHVHMFDFIAGYEKRVYKEQDPVNIEAAELMGQLHDKLKEIGYTGHALELYLVRLLFCLFADDSNIFEKGIFQEFLELKTNEDGSDLAALISQLFQVLNTPEKNRFKNLDETLTAFPYINGKLFEEHLTIAHFDSKMRQILIACSQLNWGKISPAIFGSLFQSVIDKKARRNLGAHYTSEKNILKLIKPLFLDDLWEEFEVVKRDKRKLKAFHLKLSRLRFLDPACGCGNFLIITYRELRLLELQVVKIELKGQQITNINDYFLIDVDRFYGIEIEEFPSQITQVAMWLIDHQMNEQASITFGDYYIRIPLNKSATIINGNALRIDWHSLINPMPWEKYQARYHYILGNPPFIGKKEQNEQQKEDMIRIFRGVKGAGVLDYVAAWYVKSSEYIQISNKTLEKDLPKTKVAFVSTNSITQGEQVGILWNELFNKFHIKLHFAHKTFKWSNEGKGQAAVHVIITGFSNFDISEKSIFEYISANEEVHHLKVKNINAYLVEGNEILLPNRKKPVSDTQEVVYGSFALDDGHYTLSKGEKEMIIENEPSSEKFIRPFIGGRELLHSEERYCLWLMDAAPEEIRGNQTIMAKVNAVRKWRLASDRKNTKNMANNPTMFAEIRQPTKNYIAFPTVSSVNRKYIPIAFLTPDIIASNQVYIMPDADMFSFGILTSQMHMVWVKYVCGRFKSDYRYSASIVFNNYPWPENTTNSQKNSVIQAATDVLNARKIFRKSTLADLYDPNTMPPQLFKAHLMLDKMVDNCYRKQPFTNEAKRIEFLFELYQKYTAGLFKTRI